ncbi:MAG: von Willebrand factor type domain, partial [Actinomycetota bacterium]|nr:von Willebrand factor type domain [Actinomycetota bacterium]
MRPAGALATGIAAASLVLGPFAATAVAATAVADSGTPTPAASASASTVASAPTGRIESQVSKVGQLQVTFSAVGLAPGQSIDLSSVRVFLDTTPIDATATVIGGAVTSAAPQVARTAVLVVDISGSMKGPGLDGAKKAAQAFLGAVPPDVKVGLITVSTAAALVVPPTTDRVAVAKQIAALVAV